MPEMIPDFAAETLTVARRSVQSILGAAGVEDAAREARLLIEFATGLTPEQVLLNELRPLAGQEARSLAGALARRLAHEPLSRIKGERDFYGRTFTVTPAVLDPRPETELIVEEVLAWADTTGGRLRPLTILDVGTGSGCILATLLAELPNARGVGTDVSVEALEVARANAGRNDVAARASFKVARSLDGVDGPFDVLVSNPPYIPAAEMAALDPAVRSYDPAAALDGGPDGLAVYRQVSARAGAVVPSGLIVFEVGAGQAGEVARILTKSVENRAREPWSRTDLGGHTRTVAMLTQS